VTFTPIQQAEIRETLASYVPSPTRSRRGAPVLVALVTMAVIAVVGFGALAWFDGVPREAAQAGSAGRGDDPGQLARERELVALRAAHQQMIATLERRIAELEAGGETEVGASMAELSAEIEEVRAESYQLEVEATLGQDRPRSRERSQRGAESANGDRGRSSESAGARGSGGAGPLDENPYDGVTSATNLNNTVWGEREAAAPDPLAKHAAPSSVEDLIESAIKGPAARGASEGESGGVGTNSLPAAAEDGLPQRPPRRAVRKVMGSMLPEVRRCGGDPYNRLVVELTVAGATGRVISARTIDRTHAGTPIGSCAAKVVRLARFPRFQQGEVVIKYPFDL
jgi:hypothetical protein